jgi:hypothetical protein
MRDGEEKSKGKLQALNERDVANFAGLVPRFPPMPGDAGATAVHGPD